MYIYVYKYHTYASVAEEEDAEEDEEEDAEENIFTKEILDLIWQGWRKFEQVQDSLFRIRFTALLGKQG